MTRLYQNTDPHHPIRFYVQQDGAGLYTIWPDRVTFQPVGNPTYWGDQDRQGIWHLYGFGTLDDARAMEIYPAHLIHELEADGRLLAEAVQRSLPQDPDAPLNWALVLREYDQGLQAAQ